MRPTEKQGLNSNKTAVGQNERKPTFLLYTLNSWANQNNKILIFQQAARLLSY